MDLNVLINRNQYLSDLFNLFFIFIITILFCYFAGSFLSRVLFIIYFTLFLRSKNDYFWIAFFLLVSLSPGGLFSGGTFDAYGRVPLFTVIRGFSFTFFEIFTFLAVLKARYARKSINQIPFKRNLLIFLIYILSLLVYSFLLGISTNNIVLTFRYLLPLSFFYIIPRLLRNPEDYLYFILLILPFSVLDFSGQVYQLLTGKILLSKGLNLSHTEMEQKFSQLGGFRVLMAPYLNLLCFIFGLFLFYCKKIKYRFVLLLIVIINYLSIFLTATRGWIIAYSFILIVLFLLTGKRSLQSILQIALSLTIVFLLFFAFPIVKDQFIKASERLSTVEKLVEGDMTAGGTVSRITVRGPRVMERFYESPIIGFGFSNYGYQYDDAHVGNQNLLREGGIIEAMIFIFFFSRFMLILFKTRKKLNSNNTFKDSLVLFIIGLIGIFIIHSSSVQIFGFALGFQSRVFLAVFIMFAGFFAKYSLSLDIEQQNEKIRIKHPNRLL